MRLQAAQLPDDVDWMARLPLEKNNFTTKVQKIFISQNLFFQTTYTIFTKIFFMKKILPLLFSVVVLSCNNTTENNKTAEVKETDSTNEAYPNHWQLMQLNKKVQTFSDTAYRALIHNGEWRITSETWDAITTYQFSTSGWLTEKTEKESTGDITKTIYRYNNEKNSGYIQYENNKLTKRAVRTWMSPKQYTDSIFAIDNKSDTIGLPVEIQTVALDNNFRINTIFYEPLGPHTGERPVTMMEYRDMETIITKQLAGNPKPEITNMAIQEYNQERNPILIKETASNGISHKYHILGYIYY